METALVWCHFGLTLFHRPQEEAAGSDGPCVSVSPPRAPRWWLPTSVRSQRTRPWGAYQLTSGDRVTWQPWWTCPQKRVWRSWSQASKCVRETEEIPQANRLHVSMLQGSLHAFFSSLFCVDSKYPHPPLCRHVTFNRRQCVWTQQVSHRMTSCSTWRRTSLTKSSRLTWRYSAVTSQSTTPGSVTIAKDGLT